MPSVNVVPLIGHGSLRALTMADPMQKADSRAIAAMRRHLADALAEGATGFSTGLFYPLNAPADIEEVTMLAELLPAHGGVYATHMRNEHDGVMSSLGGNVRDRRPCQSAGGGFAPQVRRPRQLGPQRRDAAVDR